MKGGDIVEIKDFAVAHRRDFGLGAGCGCLRT
jgi:hypothetical protein